jgi:endonuclease/exonuclease/phosphatase (EEP) superfamily protein YafD
LVLRALVLLLAALLATPSGLLTGCRLLGGARRTPIPQLAAFAPWATIGWTLVLVLLLAGRWWWIAVPAGAFVVVQFWWILPTLGSGAAAGARPGSIDVRVMSINVKAGAADVDQVLRLVKGHGIDLLVVQEGQPRFVDPLILDLQGQLPHVLLSNCGYSSGTVFWSRWPISQLGPTIGLTGEIARVQLHVPGAVPVTVTGVHTFSPGRRRIARWSEDLRTLRRASERTTGAQVMLGDFNASRDHAPFRALLRTGLVDAAEAVRMTPWSGVTWPTDVPRVPASVRLDHVLVTPASIGVRSVKLVTVSGTDHRAVLADLAFEPAH